MFTDAIAFFESLINPHTWVRVGMIILGGILVVFALTYNAQDRFWFVKQAMRAI
jgi:hypothetical protein